MKRSAFATIFAAAALAAFITSPAGAKTAKECRAEWSAHKAEYQAKGITQKAYVATCRAEGANPAAAKTAAKEKSTSAAGKKTVKECRAEWRANKAANQAKGITEKAYVEHCRSDTAMTAPPPAAMKKTTEPNTTTPTAAATKQATRSGPAPGAGTPTGANQYASESAARTHCRTGIVVWANLRSKIYHFSGNKNYGHTKQGAYMCEKDATAQGMRAAKNEKHP